MVCTKLTAHVIETGDATPVDCPPYRTSSNEQELFDRDVEKLLAAGSIEPSYFSRSSPLLLMPKGPNEWRVINYYRLLNKITVKDNSPLPNSNSRLDLLGRAKYYVVLDMTGGYWQIPSHEKSPEKSAFITLNGLNRGRSSTILQT